jgi:uncharacterized protein
MLLVVLWSMLAFTAFLLPPAASLAWAIPLTVAFLWLHTARLRWNRPLRAWSRLRWPPPAPGPTALLAPGLFVLVLALAVFLLAAGLAQPDVHPEPVRRMLEQPWGALPFLFLVVVTAPVIEEVGFRGWIQRPLERRVGAGVAVAVSALLFGLAHLGSALLPARIAGGLVLAQSVHLTRSVWTGILLHSFWNAAMLVVGGLAPDWDPTGAGWRVAAPALLGALAGFGWCLGALRLLEARVGGGRAGRSL